MAAGYTLPPPAALDIHDAQAADKWKRFKWAWTNYALATQLNEKPEAVQVATLLTVIGEEAREVFSTFTGWSSEGDDAKIEPVLEKFAQYCQPRKNVPFERYRFNRRIQEPGETYDQYRTALRKLAEGCEFQTISPDEILRDRLVFGIQDNKVRERLLREASLTLLKTDEICHAAESMLAQMKVVGDNSGATVSVVRAEQDHLHNPTDQTKKTLDAKPVRECWNCGHKHEYRTRESCPAYGKVCNKCQKPNHFAAKCRSGKTKRTLKQVQAIDEDADEVYHTQVSVASLDDSQLVTLRLESGNYLRFQVDTGAQCNVIPLALYKKACKDPKLVRATPVKTTIQAYGGTTLPVVGKVIIRVWRGDFRCKLDCKLVDNPNIRPLLGRKACLGMKLVSYLDNDELHKPITGNSTVYTLNGQSPISKEQLIAQHPKVFNEGVGQLEGKYHIRLDHRVDPVQHAPRRVPVALRDQLKETLEGLVQQDIIAPVTKPTPWISSMVVVPKKNGTLRICLDPKDLNKAIQREHYPLPTIEDIATRLHGAKVFTILDVRNGFWHVVLDEPSSFITTFHTPFGRYRWKRMPFGICSAPEVFQRRMHELIEGLNGVEVIADDFVTVGFGDTLETAILDHDQNLKAFLQRCEERKVRLNAEKLQLRKQEVPFIGHVATGEGLCADPGKVRAITEMPPPPDVAAVRRLLGLVQYLSKFLPHLSDITKPLRESTQKDTAWVWDHAQQTALDTLKKAVTSTPVLRYYNLADEVTLQCDASQSGLGAAMMQNGQPVAYASRALTSAETRYAQIEKELLAIVFACDHFDAYIYGRDAVHVETDHKPLECIVLKPLNGAPKRLQRMLLRLQKYNLLVKYKKGSTMFLADTLSRAFLPDVSACEFSRSLEDVDHTITLALSEDHLQQVKHMSADDPVLQVLREVIRHGWPESKSDVPESIHAYYDFRDELTVQDQLVFKGQLLVVPAAMRKEMMAVAHATHIGTEGCIRRARDSMYWPRMTTELKEYVSKCDICLAHRATPGKEPLMQHDFEGRPWHKIGADLCELHGRTLLVVCDYYSNFIEVERIHKTTTSGVTKALKAMFARYGSPSVLVSDNGPQFGSTEFATFAKTWRFEHHTSSPHYPQSNGKAENAVKTVKRLFTKCRESGQSEFFALLDWRNTPTEGIGTSPAQRFLGRRCKTLLPMSKSLLHPRYSTEEDTRALNAQKQHQPFYYNRQVKPLNPITPGDTVRMRLPGQSTWSAGVCTSLAGPRSYRVKVGESQYRRNRRQLLCANEPPLDIQDTQIPDVDSPSDDRQEPNSNESGIPPPSPDPPPCRSGRPRKSPAWMADYVPS